MDELTGAMSAEEWATWRAMNRIHPIFDWRAGRDRREAYMAAMAHNVHRGKGQRAIRTEDMMLRQPRRSAGKADPAEAAEKVKALFGALAARGEKAKAGARKRDRKGG